MKETIADKVRIEHVYDCIDEIENALSGIVFEHFSENHVLRIAVVKWLEIIGEAANHISEETKRKYDKIEWTKMIGLRNFVVHEYFGINYETVWQTATVDLQRLKKELNTINTD